VQTAAPCGLPFPTVCGRRQDPWSVLRRAASCLVAALLRVFPWVKVLLGGCILPLLALLISKLAERQTAAAKTIMLFHKVRLWIMSDQRFSQRKMLFQYYGKNLKLVSRMRV
jgi:hypothetical protein